MMGLRLSRRLPGVLHWLVEEPLVLGRLSKPSLPPGAWMPFYPAAAGATTACASPCCWCMSASQAGLPVGL